MNSLQRSIEVGEIVILRGIGQRPEFWADLRFRCDAGFGMSAETIGSKIVGVYMCNRQESVIEGREIDPVATKIYQETGRIPAYSVNSPDFERSRSRKKKKK